MEGAVLREAMSLPTPVTWSPTRAPVASRRGSSDLRWDGLPARPHTWAALGVPNAGVSLCTTLGPVSPEPVLLALACWVRGSLYSAFPTLAPLCDWQGDRTVGWTGLVWLQ